MAAFTKSSTVAKSGATSAGSVPTADRNKAVRMLDTWGIEVTDTEIRRYLAGQAALKGNSRLSKKEFMKTKVEDEYSESLLRKLWVVPRGDGNIDAHVASLRVGAVVCPGLLFKAPSGIDLSSYWFVDASIPIETLGLGVMEHHTAVKGSATTTSETGGGLALTSGAGSSGDWVRPVLADVGTTPPATTPVATAKRQRVLTRVYSEEVKAPNTKDDFEHITQETLAAAPKGLWYNSDPAVKDTVQFWLKVFVRHMDKVYTTWQKKQQAPSDTPKVAW